MAALQFIFDWSLGSFAEIIKVAFKGEFFEFFLLLISFHRKRIKSQGILLQVASL